MTVVYCVSPLNRRVELWHHHDLWHAWIIHSTEHGRSVRWGWIKRQTGAVFNQEMNAYCHGNLQIRLLRVEVVRLTATRNWIHISSTFSELTHSLCPLNGFHLSSDLCFFTFLPGSQRCFQHLYNIHIRTVDGLRAVVKVELKERPCWPKTDEETLIRDRRICVLSRVFVDSWTIHCF